MRITGLIALLVAFLMICLGGRQYGRRLADATHEANMASVARAAPIAGMNVSVFASTDVALPTMPAGKTYLLIVQDHQDELCAISVDDGYRRGEKFRGLSCKEYLQRVYQMSIASPGEPVFMMSVLNCAVADPCIHEGGHL